VKNGGLFSYGPKTLELYKDAGAIAARILDNVPPSQIPVQENTKFELVINRATATAMALTVPPDLLAQADEIID
jgi:putative ABC transport system substrate-binding protein